MRDRKIRALVHVVAARRRQPRVSTIVVQNVACDLSNGRGHSITLKLASDGQLLAFSCECDTRYGRGTGRSGWRLGQATCGRITMLIKAFMEDLALNDDVSEEAELRSLLPNNIFSLIHDAYDFAERLRLDRNEHDDEYARPAERILGGRLSKELGLPHNDLFAVKLDGNKPAVVHFDSKPIARKRGAFWQIDITGAAPLLGHVRDRCVFCERRFTTERSAAKHFGSRAHLELVEDKFLHALDSIMSKVSD